MRGFLFDIFLRLPLGRQKIRWYIEVVESCRCFCLRGCLDAEGLAGNDADTYAIAFSRRNIFCEKLLVPGLAHFVGTLQVYP